MNNIVKETKNSEIFFTFLDKKFTNSTHMYDTTILGDKETNNNIKNIENYFSFDKLILVNQVHGDDIYFYKTKTTDDLSLDQNFITADCVITREKNIAIAVKTADCAPILISDYSGSVVCALHCGWRGALSDLIKKSISKLNEYSKDKKYWAIIGPCISRENYEVDKNFMNNFLQESELNKQFFHIKNSSGKNEDIKDIILFDLPNYTKHKLMSNGVMDINVIPECTYSNEELYPSYRRNYHKSLVCNQRMLSIICIK